ncbi:MAG: 50S ribosome-binding GTPase [Sandaracinus sp.]|nr:50S ribosome-binding GTPase [Sandaracinus sp.]MCB9880157.1 50S ribosome-binding GTPase [Planctomycetota bacterium]
MSDTTPEPAVRSYFFGKGYRDVTATIRDAWARNLASARDLPSRVPSGEMEIPAAILLWTASLSTIVFGTALFVVASAIHIVLLSVVLGGVYVTFSLLWLVERAHLAARAYFVACPTCGRKSRIPQYACSSCGRIHRRLYPNEYGIFRHRCVCGEKLPATFFLNRGQLRAQCSSGHPLERAHVESVRRFIPLVGTPNAGKSAFINALVVELHEAAAETGVAIAPVDQTTEAALQWMLEGFRAGRPPAKTTQNTPRALTFRFERSGKTDFVLYLYDPAGEAFDEVAALAEHRFLEYLSGLAFLVDPTRLQAFSQRQVHPSPAERSLIDVAGRLVLSLRSDHGAEYDRPLKKPIAVVVTKADLLEGDPEFAPHLQGLDDRDADAAHAAVRAQLIDWGEAGLVNTLESGFSDVRYFVCSPLGREPDGSGAPFSPAGARAPIGWILTQASRRSKATGTIVPPSSESN